MTGFLERADPQPGALEGCGAPDPSYARFYSDPAKVPDYARCRSEGSGWYSSRPRACVGCGGHLHSWARLDARYCSARCRMRAMRARRRREDAARPATPGTGQQKP